MLKGFIRNHCTFMHVVAFDTLMIKCLVYTNHKLVFVCDIVNFGTSINFQSMFVDVNTWLNFRFRFAIMVLIAIGNSVIHGANDRYTNMNQPHLKSIHSFSCV